MFQTYNNDNVFYKILHNELPCRKVYEDDFVLSFHDINPNAKVHVLVIPKNLYVNYFDFITRASMQEVVQFNKGIYNTVKVLGLKDFCLVSNNGQKMGQEVFHLHFHILSND